MSLTSLPLNARAREDLFVSDLATLFRRYGVRTGTPDCLDALAPQFISNSSLRSDLFALCNAISRMSKTDLTAAQLLPMVVKAVVGPHLVDGSAAIPEAFAAAFVTGFTEWQARIDSLPEFQFEAPDDDPEWRKANKFSAAAGLTARQTRSERGSATEVEDIPPQTPIGDLTISELRAYLNSIEQRMERLQPFLEGVQGLGPVTKDGGAKAEQVSPGGRVTSESPEARLPTELSSETEQSGLEDRAAHTSIPSVQPLNGRPGAADISSKPHSAQSGLGALSDPARRTGHTRLHPAHDQSVDQISESHSYVFRSLERQGGDSHPVLWAVAALTLLAPAAYYGQKHLSRPNTTSHQSAPVVIATPPADSAPALDSTPAPVTEPDPSTTSATERPVRRSTPVGTHLQPRAVQMAAEAARAEKQTNSSERTQR